MTQPQGLTLSDSKGIQRIRKLQERSRHIDEQMKELKEKRRLIRYEAWQTRSEVTPNAFMWLLCRIMMQCYR